MALAEDRLRCEQGLTDSPVPVRMSSLEAALGPQRELEIGDIGAVPRQEETSEMDLGESPNEPIDRGDLTGSTNFIRNTYHRVQIHMGVDEV